ncbi:NAD(P)-dependent oxidoreductase [Candidatus Nitrosotalea okcheonensis]|uniref:Putative NAD binding domain of 6-phosphogluconate dehydrogenase n=1 Tax=Candidatus Nitrosotalea okcheonensis TaxID=1903276 RepID=A0A2H1FE33_9ARCH|nr:NAD(P)-dependent oxidoreductase [Candidatus Nitrosotalea okcheonensis]SMH71007.1 putative NAD binding domain of 6-phosphogluconate dehydrogenase [Candidatus Nitrosotalea okcheonensis]
MNVGIIGTGLLGSAIARRIATSGHNVHAYNRTRQKAESLEKSGIVIEDSPTELAKKCDVVITIVKDVQAIEEVSFGKNGIVNGKHKGLVVADMSTINPISSRKIAKKFSDNGISMIDAPVMGGPSLAEKGKMTIMVGGKKETYQKCKSVLDLIGEKTFHLGENGSGHAMKLAMNSQIAILALSISEGIILAKKSGLDPLTFLEVLNSTYFKTGMSVNKGPKMVKGEFEPSFFLKMMQKDLDEIDYTAKKCGANMPMSRLANQIYQKAINEGFGDIDYTGILAYLEKSG